MDGYSSNVVGYCYSNCSQGYKVRGAIMQTMENKYIPTWERNYNKWDTEPEVWDTLEIPADNEKEDLEFANFMKSLNDLEIEEIEQQDELKQKLRHKAGNYTYWIGMLMIALSIIVYSVLGVLNIMDTEHIVMYLGVYLISQVVIGVTVFNHLLKKYD